MNDDDDAGVKMVSMTLVSMTNIGVMTIPPVSGLSARPIYELLSAALASS